jgi:hypothetical protein
VWGNDAASGEQRNCPPGTTGCQGADSLVVALFAAEAEGKVELRSTGQPRAAVPT